MIDDYQAAVRLIVASLKSALAHPMITSRLLAAELDIPEETLLKLAQRRCRVYALDDQKAQDIIQSNYAYMARDRTEEEIALLRQMRDLCCEDITSWRAKKGPGDLPGWAGPEPFPTSKSEALLLKEALGKKHTALGRTLAGMKKKDPRRQQLVTTVLEVEGNLRHIKAFLRDELRP